MPPLLAVNVLDPHSLLSSFGPIGVAVVLFAETGLLVGFFLPGDSLLFTAGVLAAAPASAKLHLPLGWVLVEGRDRAEGYLARYGHARAIVLARFVPVVRTVLNPLAGILQVPLRTFTVWQVAGGVAWSLGVTLAGYWLGSSISNVDHYLLPIVAVIVVLSLVPIAIEIVRNRRRSAGPAAARQSPEAGE